MHGDVVCVLVETHQSVAPANVHVILGGPLSKDSHKPWLLDGKHERLAIRDAGQIQRKCREHGPRGRVRRFSRPSQDAVETSMVEDPNPLAGNPIRARLRVGSRQRVHDDRSQTRQPELTGQHQSVRTGSSDDDVIHLAQLTSAGLGGQQPSAPR
jgi:hypothetical protein